MPCYKAKARFGFMVSHPFAVKLRMDGAQDGSRSCRLYGAASFIGMLSPGFILHPTDEGLSAGTPARG
jgi:hypothetical protein